jgi:hypothetical protein
VKRTSDVSLWQWYWPWHCDDDVIAMSLKLSYLLTISSLKLKLHPLCLSHRRIRWASDRVYMHWWYARVNMKHMAAHTRDTGMWFWYARVHTAAVRDMRSRDFDPTETVRKTVNVNWMDSIHLTHVTACFRFVPLASKVLFWNRKHDACSCSLLVGVPCAFGDVLSEKNWKWSLQLL